MELKCSYCGYPKKDLTGLYVLDAFIWKCSGCGGMAEEPISKLEWKVHKALRKRFQKR